MFKKIILFLILITVCAFDPQKDENYYRNNLEEVRDLVKGRCALIIKENTSLKKDKECELAYKIYKEQTEPQQKKTFINKDDSEVKNNNSQEKSENTNTEIEVKNFDYFKKLTMSSVDDFIKDCDFGINISEFECDSAKNAKKQLEEDEKNKIEYQKYYEKYMNEKLEEYEEELVAKKRGVLIEGLKEILKRKFPDEQLDEIRKIQEYKDSLQSFINKPGEGSQYIEECMNSDDKMKINKFSCLAAVDAMLKRLNSDEDIYQKKLTDNDNRKESLKRLFKENPKKIKELLNGRCKEIMAHPWYNKTSDMTDEECNVAVEMKKRLEKEERERKVAEVVQKKLRDYDYFKQQEFEVTHKFVLECEDGIQKSVYECKNAKEAEKFFKEQFLELEKYTVYYDKHILAAKFEMMKCKASTLKFNGKCKAAVDIIEKYKGKEKVKDIAQLQRYKKYFLEHIDHAQEILNGRCKEIMADPWYYLDVNMQDEECDAADGAVNGASALD